MGPHTHAQTTPQRRWFHSNRMWVALCFNYFLNIALWVQPHNLATSMYETRVWDSINVASASSLVLARLCGSTRRLTLEKYNLNAD